MHRNEAFQFVVRGVHMHELRFHLKHAGPPGEDVNVGHADDSFGAHAFHPNAGHAIGQGGGFPREERAGGIHPAERALLLDLRVLGMHYRSVSCLLQPVQILFQTVIPKSGHDSAGCLVGAGQLARATELFNVSAVRDLAVNFVERANLHQQNRFSAVFSNRLF